MRRLTPWAATSDLNPRRFETSQKPPAAEMMAKYGKERSGGSWQEGIFLI